MVLAFAVATPANAQFGNLMNKAKKAVKEKVDNTLKDSKQKEEGTVRAASDKSDSDGVSGVTGVSRDYSSQPDASPAAEMPKGVSVPETLMGKADAEARKQWGAGFVKSVFLTSQWKEFKNPKYPYQVMHRSMDVDFIVKEGDSHFVYHWVLKEGVFNGKGTGTFSIMARMKHPTKEKVSYK